MNPSFRSCLLPALLLLGVVSCSNPTPSTGGASDTPPAPATTVETEANEPETSSATRPDRTDWGDLHAAVGGSPEEVTRLWFEAVFRYMNPETRDDGRVGMKLLSLPLQGHDDWDRLSRFRVVVERLQSPDQQHIFRSYVRGTSPESDYQLEGEDWVLDIQEVRQQTPARAEVMLKSSGASAPRKMLLVKATDSGQFYVAHFSMLAAIMEQQPGRQSEERRPAGR